MKRNGPYFAVGPLSDCYMLSPIEYSLRPFAPSDLERTFQWSNSGKVRESRYYDQPITWEDHYAWYKSQSDRGSRFLICEWNQRPIGAVDFMEIQWQHGRAQWGFYLGDDELPKGTGTAMCYTGIEYAFHKLRFRKITAEVLASNVISRRLHETLGFSQEGCFREHVFKNGNYYDVYNLALFQSDWQSQYRASVQRRFFRT
jgi:UDP-4-amino-4,6-dideoxy-N-acetyl-beta-L-altrosamine N-acetyltransferase